MVDCATRPGVVAVCKIFHINDDSKLLVDIISDEGKTWSKGILISDILIDYFTLESPTAWHRTLSLFRNKVRVQSTMLLHCGMEDIVP